MENVWCVLNQISVGLTPDDREQVVTDSLKSKRTLFSSSAKVADPMMGDLRPL